MTPRPRPVMRDRPRRTPPAAYCEFCGREILAAALQWVRLGGTLYPVCGRSRCFSHASQPDDDTREDAIR